MVAQAPSRGTTISRFLSHLLYGAASLALTAGSHSQSLPVMALPRQLRNKVRGLPYFVSEA